MTSPQSHPADLLPELAMGILPEVDASPCRTHLASCMDCREELEEMARVTSLLPLAVEDLDPSPALKADLMARIAQEPRAAVVPFRQPRPRRWALQAAAAILALAVTGTAAFVAGQSRDGDSGLDARTTALARSAAQGTLQRASASEGSIQATLVRAPGASEGFVWLEGMPELSEGRTFKAWFIRDGADPRPSAAFHHRDGGVWLDAGGPIEAYGAVAFTVEQSEDASKPSGTPVAIIPLKTSAAPPGANPAGFPAGG